MYQISLNIFDIFLYIRTYIITISRSPFYIFYGFLRIHRCVCVYRCIYTYIFSGDKYIGSFHNLDMINSAVISIYVQISLLQADLDNPTHILRSGIVLSFSNSAFCLLFTIDKYLSCKVIGSIMISTCISQSWVCPLSTALCCPPTFLTLVSFLLPDCLHCTYFMEFEGALYIYYFYITN